MSDPRDSRHKEVSSAESDVPDRAESIEVYETDTGTVFYDARNPLAWIETSIAERLSDRA